MKKIKPGLGLPRCGRNVVSVQAEVSYSSLFSYMTLVMKPNCLKTCHYSGRRVSRGLIKFHHVSMRMLLIFLLSLDLNALLCTWVQANWTNHSWRCKERDNRVVITSIINKLRHSGSFGNAWVLYSSSCIFYTLIWFAQFKV